MNWFPAFNIHNIIFKSYVHFTSDDNDNDDKRNYDNITGEFLGKKAFYKVTSETKTGSKLPGKRKWIRNLDFHWKIQNDLIPFSRFFDAPKISTRSKFKQDFSASSPPLDTSCIVDLGIFAFYRCYVRPNTGVSIVLTRTAGHIDVGGRMCCLYSPQSQTGL